MVVEHIFPFDLIWTCLFFLFLPVIFRIMSHIFFAGVLELSLETYCCQDVLLAVFIVLRAKLAFVWHGLDFDLFLYSYEAEFVQSLLQAGKKHLAQQFNFTYRYIDDVLSLKNTKFAEYLEFIYPRELEIKETTETSASSSYLDCYFYIDNGKLTTRLYDKRDDFNFPIVNFPFPSSNIPSAPAYGVYVSQLIRYARTCSNYQDFMERGKVLTQKLLSQGYQKTKLVATLKKIYGRHHDLVNPYNVAVSRIVSDVFASDAP